MGTMHGYKQVSLYVDPKLYAQVNHISDLVGEKVYVFINKAIAAAIEQRTSPEQRRALEVLMGGPITPAETPTKKPKKRTRP